MRQGQVDWLTHSKCQAHWRHCRHPKIASADLGLASYSENLYRQSPSDRFVSMDLCCE
jgi:hypothetical protein